MSDESKGYDGFLAMEGHHREPGGVDEATGWRYEWWDIGMTRNATADNRRKLKVFLDPAPHVVLDQNVPLRGWYKSKYEPPGVRARPCYTEALLTQPYGGSCPVRCIFCYVNNGLRGYRGQGVTVVDPNYPNKIAKQVAKMQTGAAFYISSFTEPFQVLEQHYHNTQRLEAVANHVGLPVFFLTRQVPPGWAVDAVKRNQFSYFQFSINTPSREDWRRLSPRAAPLDAIMGAVKDLSRRGVYVSIQCNPLIPGVVSNEDVVRLIHELAEVGAKHVIFKFVELVSPAAATLVRTIKRAFPDRGEAFEALFTDTIGGMRSVSEDYRIRALDLFKRETTKAGITMGLCYEYGYERDQNGKVTDKTGVSLGPRFTTGDQCHGRRVPVFSRPSTKVRFTPINGCSPGGCLYCAEASGGEARVPCGNALLAQATALKPSDYRGPAWRLHRR